MNWTGGRLSRHSTAAGSLKNRQKQHFAQVQAALRNGAKKPSPLKWSTFNRIEDRPGSQSRTFTVHAPREHKPEESQSIQPLRFPRLHNTHSARHENPRHSTHSIEPRRQSSQQYIKRELSSVSDDDLYNTTPPLQGTLPVSDREIIDRKEEESVSEKRRRILRKGDWVGISIQRPLQLAFASPKNTDKLGRRRKITDGHRARYRTKKSLTISPFVTSQQNPIADSGIGRHQDAESGRSNVRISIGGRYVQPGISSSSRPSKSRERSAHIHESSFSRAASSDLMLLDNEEILASDSSGIERKGIPFRHPEMAVFDLDSNTYGEGLEGNGAQRLHESPGNRGIPHGWDEEEFESGKKTKDNVRSIKEENAPLADSGPGINISEVSILDRNGAPRHRRLIFSSSSAPIQQPVPQSSKVSRLLRSCSSDIAESTVAQVGQPKPVVPSSQILDNEIWQTWVVPSYEEDEHESGYADEDNDYREEVSISPGASNAPAAVYSRRRISPEYIDKSSVLEGTESLDDNEEIDSSAQIVNSRISVPHKTVKDQNFIQGVMSAKVDKTVAKTYKALLNKLSTKMPETRTALKAQVGQKPAKDGNTDEIWRKFVFGSWSDGDDELDQNPKSSQVFQINKPFPGSSMIAHLPNVGFSSAVSSRPDKTLNASTPVGRHAKANHYLPSELSLRKNASIYWKPQGETQSDSYLSTGDEHMSMRSYKGSLITSDLDPGHDSMDAHASSQSVRSASPWLRKKKIIFTKPEPLVGANANLESSNTEEGTAYIGHRSLVDREGTSLKRKRRRDV